MNASTTPVPPYVPPYRLVQTWVTLWAAGLGLIVLGAVLFGRGESGGATGALLMAACVVGALVCLGRLVVEVRPGEVSWHFGYVGWPAWRQPLAEVAGTQEVRTRLIHGSGIRGSLQHRFYTVIPGGRALCLHLRDGRTVTIGAPDPSRLAAAIEAHRERGVTTTGRGMG
jgi:hypothetical protein